MTTEQADIAAFALRDMLKGGHFNICVIDKILAMAGGIPDGDDYRALSLLHCRDYKDMPASVRIALPKMIERVLSSPGMADVQITFGAPRPAGRLLKGCEVAS